MKAFKFKKKKNAKYYNIYTFVAIVLSVFIFARLDIYVNKQVAYLLATVLAAISLRSAMKKASKELAEIVFQEKNVKFYFQNKLREPLSLSMSDLSFQIINDSIEVGNINLIKVIGTVNKIDLEDGYDWDEFLKMLNLTKN